MKFSYALKDKDRQKWLDDWTDGCFSEALQYPEEEHIGFSIRYMVTCLVEPDKVSKGRYLPRVTLMLDPEEVDRTPIYDEDDWNTFPYVIPPEGVWMRAEVEDFEYGVKAKFADGKWVDGSGVECFNKYDGRNIRFRPWEDDEEKDE